MSAALAMVAATGCASPSGHYATTRTPRAGSIEVGGAAEVVTLANSADPAVTRHVRRRGLDRGIPRLRTSLSYGLTDRVALEGGGTFLFDGHVGASWNPYRSRYVDLGIHTAAGYDSCIVSIGESSSFCSEQRLERYFIHGSAIGLVGLNPARWLTLQLQAGGIVPGTTGGARTLPWFGAGAHVFITKTVAVGPNILLLPTWLLDGRTVIAPSLVMMAFPRGKNPYEP